MCPGAWQIGIAHHIPSRILPSSVATWPTQRAEVGELPVRPAKRVLGLVANQIHAADDLVVRVERGWVAPGAAETAEIVIVPPIGTGWASRSSGLPPSS